MKFDAELYEQKSEFLKVLANPIRLCIVRGLMHKGSCNVSYMKNCLSTSQSSVSQHLAKLKAAGIVKAVRNGNEINYRLADHNVEKLIDDLFEEEGTNI